jgi:hypothetical protein
MFDSPGEKAGLTTRMATTGALSGAMARVLPVEEVTELLWEMLDLPLGDLVRGAWNRHRLVEKAKANTRGKPGAIEKVAIAGHTVRSTHHPRIEIDMGTGPLPPLQFDLVVVLKLDAAVATVAEGALKSIAPGEATAEASLSIAGKQIAGRQLARLALPGSL